MLEQGQQTAVKRPPPHIINSPATSLGYLECDLGGAGSKVLSLSPNKQPGVAGVQLPWPLRPTPTPQPGPSLRSLINWRLGAEARFLQATSLLISTIISVWRDGPALPQSLSACIEPCFYKSEFPPPSTPTVFTLSTSVLHVLTSSSGICRPVF